MLPLAVGAVLVIALVGDPAWLVAILCLVVALGVAAAVTDESRRRRAARRWDDVPAAAVAPRVDLGALVDVRRREGEIAAIRFLRAAVPGCPLRRARGMVAELTGVPAGSR